MRLKVKDVSFTNDEEWLFKLGDGTNDYYILTESEYKKMGLNSPISRRELDSLDVGHSILCETQNVNNINVVTKIR
ncbi:hypothetical protein N7E81_01540 [Reichenbachiella carrageenanivorans]|uniref:Uncharacterized protein n=1 Tax=Reichenbachiella carrageenanivorans TaxID=2979869 RepID=A0ABY6D7G9_9BACT|nr:hypothetical protein [Reichenbachiella carrageenanivorans]UXX79790.1 hypothetical protein N7E81_01540 [Reichenbachiella carrageenanivorans]